MKYLENISDLILEKKIGQISSTIEVTFGFDLHKTNHTNDRQDPSKRDIDGHNNKFITNSEMREFVLLFNNEIARGISTGDILDGGDTFVIKSRERELAMALSAKQVMGTYWNLIVVTVFRESDKDLFKTGKNQIVYMK